MYIFKILRKKNREGFRRSTGNNMLGKKFKISKEIFLGIIKIENSKKKCIKKYLRQHRQQYVGVYNLSLGNKMSYVSFLQFLNKIKTKNHPNNGFARALATICWVGYTI